MIVTYFSHSLGPKKLVWFMTENHFRYLQTRNVQKYIPLSIFFVWIWILASQPSNLQRLPACLIKRNWKSNLSMIKLIGTLTFNGWNWKILNWLTKEARFQLLLFQKLHSRFFCCKYCKLRLKRIKMEVKSIFMTINDQKVFPIIWLSCIFWWTTKLNQSPNYFSVWYFIFLTL